MRIFSSASAISSVNANRWNDGCGVVLLTPESPVRPTTLSSVVASGASDGVPSDTTEDDWSRGSGEDPDMDIDTQTVDLNPPQSRSPSEEPVRTGPVTELDKRVRISAYL